MARSCSRCISTASLMMRIRASRSESQSGTRFRNAEKRFYTKCMILGSKWHMRVLAYNSTQRSWSSTNTTERKECSNKCRTWWRTQSIWSLMRIWGTMGTTSAKLCSGSKAVHLNGRRYSRRGRSTDYCGTWFRKMKTRVDSLVWIAQNSLHTSSSLSSARVHWHVL